MTTSRTIPETDIDLKFFTSSRHCSNSVKETAHWKSEKNMRFLSKNKHSTVILQETGKYNKNREKYVWTTARGNGCFLTRGERETACGKDRCARRFPRGLTLRKTLSRLLDYEQDIQASSSEVLRSVCTYINVNNSKCHMTLHNFTTEKKKIWQKRHYKHSPSLQ